MRTIAAFQAGQNSESLMRSTICSVQVQDARPRIFPAVIITSSCRSKLNLTDMKTPVPCLWMQKEEPNRTQAVAVVVVVIRGILLLLPLLQVTMMIHQMIHLAVAAAVASGTADVGLGILAAAKALNLDFVPLWKERYDLVIPRPYYESPLLEPLLDILHQPSFQADVEALGGYDVSQMGEVMANITP